MRLSRIQETMLWIVDEHAPASVADCAGHALVDTGRARSTLATLERRGLVDRTYTGHDRRSVFAYVTTPAGAGLASEPELAEGECDLCGLTDGRHMRACIANPDRHPARRWRR